MAAGNPKIPGINIEKSYQNKNTTTSEFGIQSYQSD